MSLRTPVLKMCAVDGCVSRKYSHMFSIIDSQLQGHDWENEKQGSSEWPKHTF